MHHQMPAVYEEQTQVGPGSLGVASSFIRSIFTILKVVTDHFWAQTILQISADKSILRWALNLCAISLKHDLKDSLTPWGVTIYVVVCGVTEWEACH